MTRTDNEIQITPSVFDRLLDFEPDVLQEAAKSRLRSLREFKQAVQRDLEWLLNTRRLVDKVDETLEEVNKSLLVYGLQDFTGAGVKSLSEQKRLTKAIESALQKFEPRFIDLKVTLEPISEIERVLHFRIGARLRIEPTLEPITFDTILQLSNGEYVVQEK